MVEYLASKYYCANPFDFRDTALFHVFFFFKKLRFKKVAQNMKFSTLWWGAYRAHYDVAILPNKYDCSNPFGIQDISFNIYIFFFKKFRFETGYQLENLNPMVICCQVTLRVCKYGW